MLVDGPAMGRDGVVPAQWQWNRPSGLQHDTGKCGDLVDSLLDDGDDLVTCDLHVDRVKHDLCVEVVAWSESASARWLWKAVCV